MELKLDSFKNLERNRLLPVFISSLSFIILFAFGANIIHFTYADTTITAAGDWGCNSNTDNTVKNMDAKNPALVFGLGDYSYTSSGSCWWTKMEAAISSPVKITFGNHEDESGEGLSGYKSHFGISQTYYAYTQDVARVIVMDTDVASPSDSAQKSFVQSELQSASTNPSIKWIIVYLHKPFYTSSNSCSSTGCTNSDSDTAGTLRNNYGAMFDQYGVDLVLQGHVHNYQRTFQLKYDSGSPSSPTIGSSNADTYTEGNGAVYAIVGTGGQGFHPLSNKASFVSKQQDDDFGQMQIKVTNSGNTLEGKYYENGVNNNNVLFDTFTITKAGNSAPVANNQAVTALKNTTKAITLTATDANNDPLTYTIVTQPAHGTITAGTGAARTYTPATNYVGPDSFTFKANDGKVDSNTATVSITVQDNSAPVANNQAVTANKNTAKAITLTATDANNDPLTYTIVTQPAHGTLSTGTGASRTYTPTSNYVGPDSFTFKANDGKVDSNTATVSITVQDTTTTCATNLPISGVTASSNNGNVPSNVLDNNLNTRWSNNPGLPAYITADLGASKAICEVDIAWYLGNERSYTFTISTSTTGSTGPFTNVFSGTSSGTTVNSEKYTFAETSARYVRITVTASPQTSNQYGSMTELDIFGSSASNSAPVANNQAVTAIKNTAKAITLTATDANNDPLTYTIVTGPAHGTITAGTGASRTYTPTSNYVGPDSFTFKANDGKVDSNTATVSITVQDTTTTCTTNLPISGVTANPDNGFGNVPENVLDNDLNTRWSHLGLPSFITADLGSIKNICSEDIAWYLGNERVYTFDIATSTDGTTFTNKLTNVKSSGTTLNFEKYTFPATDARYVRVTVTGNTANNNYASITEIDIFGTSASAASSSYNYDPSLTLSGPP